MHMWCDSLYLCEVFWPTHFDFKCCLLELSVMGHPLLSCPALSKLALRWIPRGERELVNPRTLENWRTQWCWRVACWEEMTSSFQTTQSSESSVGLWEESDATGRMDYFQPSSTALYLLWDVKRCKNCSNLHMWGKYSAFNSIRAGLGFDSIMCKHVQVPTFIKLKDSI